MSTSRFDPTPDQPYGTCLTCGEVIQTSEDATAHLSKTFDESKAVRGDLSATSHRVQGTNPDRASRIQSFVDQEIEDALENLYEELDREVTRNNLTEEELTEALRDASADLVDGWKRYIA
ncbi:hypothetical protein HOT31_gp104 [Microbacterium phage Hendrix]|uniref:Uncharacterized protein n=1 Tax=Microbacterium phage Hendrix TaxID=2182341 RepID=A0A2U8UU91_9CAUD|nr:hypothetical protein HOT31_gp104 [Microbacterium phage Hendrix]AWN07775.1 hypothetical protein PBI_HENDRIX_104 [Microbacterium phage Hendrix]